MKKFIILLVIVFIVLIFLGIKGKLPSVLPIKIVPDSKLYFLETWYEKMVLFFTFFDPEQKAEQYRIYAEKRLDEAQELMVKGKSDLAQKKQELYKYYLGKAKDALEQAIQKAIRRGEEELIDRLNKKIEEIKN
jgi:hypothetical protein